MASRKHQHGFISDSSTAIIIHSSTRRDAKTVESNVRNLQYVSKVGLLSDGDDFPEAPHAMMVSKTGEKYPIPFDTPVNNNTTNPFVSVGPNHGPDIEEHTQAAISPKKRLKHRNSLYKRLACTPRNREHFSTLQNKVNKETQTNCKVENYDYIMKTRFENIGDVPFVRRHKAVHDLNTSFNNIPPVAVLSPNSSILGDLKLSFSELKCIISILTLMTMAFWLFSAYFQEEFPNYLVRLFVKYLKYLSDFYRTKDTPKTRAEILVQYLKSFFEWFYYT